MSKLEMNSKNFLILEADEEEVIYHYFYEADGSYYSGSLEQILLRFNFLYFLHCKNVDVTLDTNLFKQINDAKSFHGEFKMLYHRDEDILSEINENIIKNVTKNSKIELIDSLLLENIE